MIKDLQSRQTVEVATPKQIAMLREAMPYTPVSQLNTLSREQASRLISAYINLKKAKSSKNTPRRNAANSRDDDDDDAPGGTANSA